MKKALLLGLLASSICISAWAAMSDAAQAVVASSVAGVVNAGTAVYMQGQGLNPQFVQTPYGATVVPGGNAQQQTQQNSGSNAYDQQNQQSQKQAFFNGD